MCVLIIKQVNGVAFFSDDTEQSRSAVFGTAVISAVCFNYKTSEWCGILQ